MEHKKEIGVGIFFLAFSVVYFILTLGIRAFDPFAAGRAGIQLTSQSIPQTVAVLVAILSVIHIITNVLKLRKAGADAQSAQSGGEKKPFTFKLDRPQRIMLITIALIFSYIFLYTRLGFILSSIIFLLGQIFLMLPADKRIKWAPFSIGLSIVSPVLIYILFTRVLGIFLPRGLLWFF